VKPDTLPTMRISRAKFAWMVLSIGLVAVAPAHSAVAQQVMREQDIVNLRLGQRVHVDDGSCPAGQVKEVSGAKMLATGVVGTRKCVPRLGPKTK
jgi:hypothetical protein